MTPAKFKALALAVIAIAAATSAFFIWRNWPPKDYPAAAVAQARRAAAQFDKLQPVPVTEKEAVVSALAAGRPIPGQPSTVSVPPDQQHALFLLIAEWLEARQDRKPDTYATWARSRGYTLTLDGPHANYFTTLRLSERQSAYDYYSKGMSPPPKPFLEMTAMDFFSFCYEEHFNRAKEMMRFVSLTGGDEGSDILFKVLKDRDSKYPSPYPLEPYEGVDRWAGFMTAGDVPHWTPDLLLKDVIQRDGEATVGVVSAALRTESGEWVPVTFSAYWDPKAGQWHFHQISYSNSLNIQLSFIR